MSQSKQLETLNSFLTHFTEMEKIINILVVNIDGVTSSDETRQAAVEMRFTKLLHFVKSHRDKLLGSDT